MTLLRILQPGDALENPPEASLFEKSLTARRTRSYTPGMILRGMAGPVPLTVLNYASHDVTNCLSSALSERQFDAVQLETSNLFSYLEIIRAAPSHPAVLLDWHNVDSELMSRYASETKSLPRKLIARRTAKLLDRLETRLMTLCDAHTVVSEREKAKLLERDPQANVTVIPNGVDTSAFAYSETTSPGTTLLFVGSMDYHANIDAVTWFARSVWPAISRRFPALQFAIVGRSPSREIRMLASKKIQVTGTVEDVRPFYANALAVVVPLRVGGGTRLKILEAMAMGVPVISTTLGAEGIAIENGKNILLADSDEQMTDALERIANDCAFRRALTEAARDLVLKRYDWTAIGNQLYEAHSQLAQARAGL